MRWVACSTSFRPASPCIGSSSGISTSRRVIWLRASTELQVSERAVLESSTASGPLLCRAPEEADHRERAVEPDGGGIEQDAAGEPEAPVLVRRRVEEQDGAAGKGPEEGGGRDAEERVREFALARDLKEQRG